MLAVEASVVHNAAARRDDRVGIVAPIDFGAALTARNDDGELIELPSQYVAAGHVTHAFTKRRLQIRLPLLSPHAAPGPEGALPSRRGERAPGMLVYYAYERTFAHI